MTIYIRKVGEVADGSITDEKLAVAAVNLGGSKVTGQLPSTAIEDGAVIESKLANLSVSTGKLKDEAVTTAKAINALKQHVYVGDETEVSVTGITETEIKTFGIVKAPAILPWLKMHVQAEMKTSDVSHAAIMKVYVDAEASPRITLNSTSATYEIQSGSAVISDLSNGKHVVKIKMVSADASATAYNDLLDVFTEI